jgi:hypothetical protein
MLADPVVRVLEALERERVRYAVFGAVTVRPRFPAGVHKHRSLASKNTLQESWGDANFSAYQQRLREELARLQEEGGLRRLR